MRVTRLESRGGEFHPQSGLNLQNQPVNLGGKISQPLKMTPTKPMHWIVALRPQSEISQVRVTENRVQISAHLRPNWGGEDPQNKHKYD